MGLNVVVYGATGMIGQAALLECFDHPAIAQVLAVGRSSCGLIHTKLEELLVDDMYDHSTVEDRLSGIDACFYSIGMSAKGMRDVTV